MCFFNKFLEELYVYLTNKNDIENNIVRKHTKKLEELGDISFPVEIKCWCSLLQNSKNNSELNIINVQENIKNLVEESKKWVLKIEKGIVIKNNLHLWLKRPTTFNTVLKIVLNEQNKYGSQNLQFNEDFYIENDVLCKDLNKTDLSELRIILLKNVICNLLQFNNCSVIKEKTLNCKSILLTTKSEMKNKNNEAIKILCGAVLNENGIKNSTTNASEFYEKRTIEMRLMAEHKYGLRFARNPGWQEYFKKLGHAAVTISLLQNRSQNTITISLLESKTTNIKGAAFILYNYARLIGLLKEFDKKVDANIYPVLPPVDSIDFSLLTNTEEWELVYVYVLQFPLIIRNCIKDILFEKVNIHCLVSMLSGLSSLFSVYYRRIRILTEPRSHLFPVLHARIYMLKVIQHVFNNGLCLLDIQPVSQM